MRIWTIGVTLFWAAFAVIIVNSWYHGWNWSGGVEAHIDILAGFFGGLGLGIWITIKKVEKIAIVEARKVELGPRNLLHARLADQVYNDHGLPR